MECEYFGNIVADVTRWGNNWFGVVRIGLYTSVGDRMSIWLFNFCRLSFGGSFPKTPAEEPLIIEYTNLYHANEKNLDAPPLKSFRLQHKDNEVLMQRLEAFHRLLEMTKHV